MRLKTIKLAGFKSFVDPTTIPLVSNLTAVVGPNGCGKSNVIDAVRWVMGESSAKHLRGGSLTDVIFSGSSTRKPVGQATVELLFDNVEGKLGGEYASYSEIAIKRQVTRDGQSNYFLNGQRCRRKDITDIFLGTGLGPRSYAIIEQGMISRVIDAKPEDLRTFIEEAAGISKYKERRRETENRIQHTQDNLSRLNDLRDELGKQLRHLERQSQAAARYQELKTTEKSLSSELAALAWQRLDTEIVEYEKQIRESLVQLAAEQAGSQQLKTSQEKQRLLQTQANETLNDVQKRYYGIGAEIAKIEQALTHHEERRGQLKADKVDAEQSLQTAEALLEKDKENYNEFREKIEENIPLHEQAVESAEMAQAVADEAEQNLESWRERMAVLSQETLAPTRLAESAKAKIAQLERQIQQIQERSKRLDAECQQLTMDDPIELERLAEKSDKLMIQRDECIDWLEGMHSQKEKYQQELHDLQSQLKATQQILHEAQGKLSALETLQASALGKNLETRKQWLADHGISNPNLVAKMIQVKSGWELAVETVLEGFLEAIGVNVGEVGLLSSEAQSLLQSGLHLLEWSPHQGQLNAPENSLANQILNKETLPSAIYQVLAQVRVATNIGEADAILAQLSQQESVITSEGYWLGQGWLKLKAQGQPESGILAREEKLKQLSQDIILHQEKVETIQNLIDELQQSLKQIDAEKETKSQEKNNLQQEISSIESERRIKLSKIEQNQKRREMIQKEMGECQSILQESQQEVNQSRTQLHQALEQMAQNNHEQEQLANQKVAFHEAVTEARLKSKEAAAKVNEIALQIQTYRTQIGSLESNIERFSTQIDAAKLKLSNLILSLEKIDEPVAELKEELEVNLEKRLTIEDELSLARDNVAKIDNETREIEKQLSSHEQKIEALREKSERVKMQWQALSVHRENVLEKLKALEASLEEILKSMPEEANEAEWTARLNDVDQKIARLGPINLAAIEEYDAALQRKEYLDSQLNDLTEALTTLENAIKKIDKETRAKFKETFDKVNGGFEALFPKLFGGGQASLTMTGEDLLDTGITLMARPPGKKNSTIQQLSGGEKALTAVALVFAIFELNPAPFCMLDEVDAPLDDNNVGRFCKLVKEMSSTVQFIYVSHNKLAIEMGDQLQGVTMREPGVSRLVTVDIEEAKTLAEA